jgi:hypothetical protein
VSTTAALVIFVVMPLVAAPIVVALVARRSPSMPAGYRTSELLAHGEAASGELVEWANKGLLLDRRPMVAMRVRVDVGEPFELTITQSVARADLARLQAGMTVDLRLSPDHRVGAVVLDAD